MAQRYTDPAVADREHDFDACLIKLADAYVRFATKHSALIGLMFAAKHQAAAPPELIEPTDPRVCVRTSYHRRRVSRRPGSRR